MPFNEICICQVRPQKAEEFETPVLEAKSFWEKQEGLLLLRLIKRGYHIDMEQIKEGIPPLKINRIVISQRTLYMIKKFFSYFLPPLFLVLFLSGCGKTEPIRQSGFYFDTIISVTLYDNSKTAELEHCFELADLYESYFSSQRAESDISKINAAKGKAVHVHDETLELIEKGLYYSRLSGGKFDITIGNLTSLWDFHSDTPVVPAQAAIEKAVSAIDYENVRINGNEVALKHTDAALDLGGIAKGYIADKMKEYLLSEGITSGMINLGGNVLVIGTKDHGEAYAIGIQRPFDESGAAVAAVKIKDQSVVTSGIYERYFEQDGIRYHHILDVDTGFPYDNGLTSVSIICKNSVDGDGLSTTCFALGLEKGLQLIESLEDTEAVFITSDSKLHCSSGIGTAIPIQRME